MAVSSQIIPNSSQIQARSLQDPANLLILSNLLIQNLLIKHPLSFGAPEFSYVISTL